MKTTLSFTTSADIPSFKPVYLASNVKMVKFSYKGENVNQIILILDDGSYSLFDPEGYPYQTGNNDSQ